MKTLLLLLFVPSVIAAQTGRGRVSIQNGTLVTDQGTLLRGAYISTDFTDNIASPSEISAIKFLGLNCIHLYAECAELQAPGDKVALVDSIIDLAEDDSLYVIMTIGGCNRNGEFDSAFVHDFWEFYAPRYAGRPHVIYEIMNEPFAWQAPYDLATLEMEKWAYNLIRSLAPETHILLMSYASAVNELSMVEDLDYISDAVEWDNASLAIHGYGTASENTRDLITTVKNSGYAITVTEPEEVANSYLNLAPTRVFEEEFVSYTHFINVTNLVNDPSVYIEILERSELRWEPDFGTWPQSIAEINYINPYEMIEAGFYDEGYGLALHHGETYFGYISSNNYLAYYNLDFQEGPVSFTAQCSGNNGGSIELHLDSLEGIVIGTCTVTPTGAWDVYSTFSCGVTHFEGIHKIYMLFRGNEYDLFNIKSFVFNKPVDNIEIEDLSVKEGPKIYPVPADELIYVAADKDCRAEIYNLQGQFLFFTDVSPDQNSVDVSRLAPGNYVLNLISEGEVVPGFFSVR